MTAEASSGSAASDDRSARMPSEDSSVRSWPVGTRMSSTKAALGNRMNKSVDATAATATTNKSSVILGLAAKFEAKTAAEPPVPGKVAGLVTSIDSKSGSPTSSRSATTRSVLENSPWKNQGIGTSSSSSSNTKTATKTSTSTSAGALSKSSLTPLQQRLSETSPVKEAITPQRSRSFDNINQSRISDLSAATPGSVASSYLRQASITASPGAATPSRIENSIDWTANNNGSNNSPAAVKNSSQKPYQQQRSLPTENHQLLNTSKSSISEASRRATYSTPPLSPQHPSSPLRCNLADVSSSSSKVLDKVSLFEQQPRRPTIAACDVSTNSGITNRILAFEVGHAASSNNANKSTSTSVSTVSSCAAQDGETGNVHDVGKAEHASLPEATSRSFVLEAGKDLPAISPFQQCGGQDPSAVSPLKPVVDDASSPNKTKQGQTIAMDLSISPSKIAAHQVATSPKGASSSGCSTSAVSNKPETSAFASIKKKGETGRTALDEADFGLEQSHSSSDKDIPRRVPVVTLFPRAGGQVFDLPTTPSRADYSMDISSLQASPIVQAEESFVTLEESWRATIFKESAFQQKEAHVAPPLGRFSPPLSSMPRASAESGMVHFAENVFCGWELEKTPSQALQEPTVDDFLAKETPRTNNQSYSSETSSSYKESFQSSRGPPTIPTRFSKSSAAPAKCKRAFAPSLVCSSPIDETSPNGKYADVTGIVAALERIIPHRVPLLGQKVVNSSILESDKDAPRTAEHTRSSDTDPEETHVGLESFSLPTDAHSSFLSNERSTVVYDDEEEDIFEGLDMEADYTTFSKQHPVGVETSNGLATSMRQSLPGVPSQTSTVTNVTSNRLYEKKLRSTVAFAQCNGKKTAYRPHKADQTSLSLQSSADKMHPKNGYAAFSIDPVLNADGALVKPHNLFQHIYADGSSSSDDSSFSSDTYTVHTLEAPAVVATKGVSVIKAFLDFLTFGDEESINTVESESLVSSAAASRLASSKRPSKKQRPKYISPADDPELTSGPPFAAVAFMDLLKLMNCDVGNDELLRTTEKHLSEEFGMSAKVESTEATVEHDPEVEALVYDAAFFDDLWHEIASKQPNHPAWTYSLCGSLGNNMASGEEDLSPEEQKIFNAVFSSTSASKDARRKAAQVLSVCRQRFPSLYESLVFQFGKKAQRMKPNRVHTPPLRVSTPVPVLPPVMDEGPYIAGQDAFSTSGFDTGFTFSQTMLSSLQETATTFMSAPSSTFNSELSEGDNVSNASSAFIDALAVGTISVATAERDELVEHTENACIPNGKQSVNPVSESKHSGSYIDALAKEKPVLDYASTEKECKEGDECCKDESTYILHYIEDFSEECYIAEISRDDSSDEDLLAQHASNNLLVDLEVFTDENAAVESEASPIWETFTPPRRKSADIRSTKTTNHSLEGEISTTRPASAHPESVSETDLVPEGHFGANVLRMPAHLLEESVAYEKSVAVTVATHKAASLPSTSASARHAVPSDNMLDLPTAAHEGQASLNKAGPIKFAEDHNNESVASNVHATPKMERTLFGSFDADQPNWEAFNASYFQAAKEQELVATVKRDNTKRVNAPKLKPSKSDKSRPHSRNRGKQSSKQSNTARSPTSVAPPKIRKLRVADLYPPNRLDFEEFDKKSERTSPFNSKLK